MNQHRDNHIRELGAQYAGYTAGLQWLINEHYYYNEMDLLICEDCGREFYVPSGDFVSLGLGSDSRRFHLGGWAGRRSGSKGTANLCHDCLQAMMQNVRNMEAAEAQEKDTGLPICWVCRGKGGLRTQGYTQVCSRCNGTGNTEHERA